MTLDKKDTTESGDGSGSGKSEKAGKPEKISLYAEHIKVQPKHMPGLFRSIKNWANVAFMAIYFLTPWLRWDRGPNAPDQAILMDLEGRRAYLLWLEIWPQEIYYLTGLLVLGALGLFFATALLGRVWCGFACIQTVFTDIFVMVERGLEGDRNARIKLDRGPVTIGKLARKMVKIVIWALISVVTGFGWAAYFNDVPTLASNFLTGDAGWGVYLSVGIVAGFCFLLAGWAREQVCIYMCPWPRFQASMFDEDSLVVTYEKWRGEPRGFAKKGTSFENRGHCVDCTLCVQVCPTGIDIRNGSQLACIGCGLCVDACNSMMDRLNLPRWLITYDSINRQLARSRGEPIKHRLVRPRTMIYAGLILALSLAMILGVANRSRLEATVLHERSPLFVTLTDGGIRNGYTFKILNKRPEHNTYVVSLKGIEGNILKVVGADAEAAELELAVEPNSMATFRVYATAPQKSLESKATNVTFVLRNTETGETATRRSLFAGPQR